MLVKQWQLMMMMVVMMMVVMVVIDDDGGNDGNGGDEKDGTWKHVWYELIYIKFIQRQKVLPVF